MNLLWTSYSFGYGKTKAFKNIAPIFVARTIHQIAFGSTSSKMVFATKTLTDLHINTGRQGSYS